MEGEQMDSLIDNDANDIMKISDYMQSNASMIGNRIRLLNDVNDDSIICNAIIGLKSDERMISYETTGIELMHANPVGAGLMIGFLMRNVNDIIINNACDSDVIARAMGLLNSSGKHDMMTMLSYVHDEQDEGRILDEYGWTGINIMFNRATLSLNA